MMRERVFLSWGLMLLLHLDPVLSVCYFPGELQGTWATQETTSRESRVSRSPISYQYVTIEPDTILEWGSCHARQHNDLILTDRSGNTRCFRCVRLNVISEKLVQVWTKDLSKCYISEDAATRNCPSVDTADSATQIMLYKVKNSWGDRDVKEIECPLNGRFSFTYRRGNEIEGVPSARCDQPTSEFSNCPYGFGFDVLYNECASFTPSRTGLQCMGSWTGVNGEEYLAVWDTAVRDGDRLPMFKCGMFREEAGTGRVFLAFSEDSTCVNSLNSPTDGYETYVLTSLPSTPLPPAVQEAKCTFPLSLLGHWHHTYVADDTIVFKDYRNFKTYSARCVHDLGDGERYIVYARTHCGEWNYNCLWLKRRSANVLEFMMGLYPKETFDDRLCDQDKFGDLTAWTTQAKSLLEEPTTCPIVGNYVGELPDASGICAQLYSDCDAPQIMYYTVSECRNGVVVSEQREYQCLGEWEEEGRVYALTFRRDIKTYECFVGVIKPGGVVFIKEAGTVCSRGVQPEVLGMKLHRKEACSEPYISTSSSSSQASQTAQQENDRPRTTRPPWFHTTRPWKPITGRPRGRGSGSAGYQSLSQLLISMSLLITLMAIKTTAV